MPASPDISTQTGNPFRSVVRSARHVTDARFLCLRACGCGRTHSPCPCRLHCYCSRHRMPKLVNPLPQALPKECAKAANICAFICLPSSFPCILMSLQSRVLSTVTTTVLMAFVSHNSPFAQLIFHKPGHPSFNPRASKWFCHLHRYQSRFPLLRTRRRRNCDRAFGKWMYAPRFLSIFPIDK